MSKPNADAENRRNHWVSQKALKAVAGHYLERCDHSVSVGVCIVPSARKWRLTLPRPPTHPDLDGAKWILEIAGTTSEMTATAVKVQNIIDKESEQSDCFDDITKDLVAISAPHPDGSLYLSVLIVQDRSEDVRWSMYTKTEERALVQLMQDPTLADCVDVDGHSCTDIAARRGCFKLLKALLKQDPERIKRKTLYSKNLLHHAAESGCPCVDMIDFLCLYKGECFAEQRDYWGATPFQVALMRGVLDDVKYLLPYTKQHLEAPSNRKGEPATCTAIGHHQGFSRGRLCHVLEILLEIIPVNSRDYRGSTALHSAVEADDELVWELLLREHRADPNIRDFHGSTAIASACERRPVSYLETLEEGCMDSRIDIDWWSIDDDGDRPLSVAKRNNDPEVAIFVATRTSKSNALQALKEFEHDYIICADIHASLRNYEAATKLLERAGPQESWTKETQRLHKIARLKLEMNAPEAAEVLLNHALAIYDKEIDPHSPNLFMPEHMAIACVRATLARAYLAMENPANALKSIEIALDVEFWDHEKSILVRLQRRATQLRFKKESEVAYIEDE